jgi:tRNA1Val (adenine37-N6)-methyltransferase
MPNSWFEFKQFKVEQSNASFKVGTDACLLGAWVKLAGAERLIDIGTGTGVIALMMAQRSTGQIHAIDRDAQNVAQAHENFGASPWKDRLSVEHCSLQEFSQKHPAYDHAVCNPPFFRGSTAHGSERVHPSRHDDHLSLSDLFTHAARITGPKGKLSLVFPMERFSACKAESRKANWYLERATFIRPKAEKEANRFLATYSKVNSPIAEGHDEIILYADDHRYTAPVNTLLAPFYLKL